AVRRVEAGYAIPVDPQGCADEPGDGATLGAVPVQDIRPQSLDFTKAFPEGSYVRRADCAADGQPDEPEREMGADLVEERVLEGAAREAVADDADGMACLRMELGEIAHMAEDPADGRPEAMDDAQGTVSHDGQNSRSRT